MHPAPSLIVFTTLSGAGFGLIFWLGVGLGPDDGWAPWLAAVLAFALAGVGLIASGQHLGNPQRAWRAFSQWRSSWLSREAVLAAATLAAFGLHAGAWLLAERRIWWLGLLCAALALATVYATSMIYAQLRTVPRWSRTPIPLLFGALAAAGGIVALAAVAGITGDRTGLSLRLAAPVLLLAAGVAVWWARRSRGVARGAGGSTPETATGLAGFGAVRMLDSPHTSPNYILKEMVFEVGRRRAAALERVALTLGLAAPLALLLAAQALEGRLWAAVALVAHLLGAAVSRWLFFAQAQHVAGLYYQRGPA